MTIKESILQSLEDIKDLATHNNIYDHIIKNNYYEFKIAKTPKDTISSQLWYFIKNNDSRVKRIKGNGNYYLYYLAKYEQNINFDNFIASTSEVTKKETKIKKSYKERDLHKLLSSHLKIRIFIQNYFT